jgi:hypothetical protein
MSQQLLEAVQTAYLKKDLITLYEMVPVLLRRIKSLERNVELMSRLTDFDGGELEQKAES